MLLFFAGISLTLHVLCSTLLLFSTVLHLLTTFSVVYTGASIDFNLNISCTVPFVDYSTICMNDFFLIS